MRLLIVEDDPDGREMLTELFSMHDWTVTAVPSTQAAMNELRAGGFDVVISDENLEGQSGSTMLRQASDEGLLRNVGVLMYTAEPGLLELPEGVRVLRKPTGLAKLLDEAKALAHDEKAVAPEPPSGERTRKKRVELVLYVTSSPSSQRARRTLEEVLATTHPARLKVVVRDLERDPFDDEQWIDTPMLVKRERGHELPCCGVDLDSAQRLTALIEQLDAEAPASSQAACGECPPSSRHVR